MAKIISHKKKIETIEYRREFSLKSASGAGCSFECDERGVLKEMSTEALENYKYCLEHPREYLDEGVKKRYVCYEEPTHAICECGKEILLEDHLYGASKCIYCGRWHNMFGQEIKYPSMWMNTI